MKQDAHERLMARDKAIPLKLDSIYLLASALWILTADLLLSWVSTLPTFLTPLQTLKGWAFAGLTGALLCRLLRRYPGEA